MGLDPPAPKVRREIRDCGTVPFGREGTGVLLVVTYALAESAIFGLNCLHFSFMVTMQKWILEGMT